MPLLEALAGSIIVIGHNVYRVLPNEVPILVALFCISGFVRRRSGLFAELRRPASWPKTIAIAFAAAAILQLGSEFVIEPLAKYFWPQPEHISSLLSAQPHDWKRALRNLAIVWVLAGFGEEVAYRGYLLRRAAQAGSSTRSAYVAAAIYVAVLFGFGHFYKGPAGVVDSTYSGLVLGSVYLLCNCNLWAAILAHGISDTFAVVALFMGWAS